MTTMDTTAVGTIGTPEETNAIFRVDPKIAKAASKEHRMLSITGVHVDRTPTGRVNYVATTGRIMVVRRGQVNADAVWRPMILPANVFSTRKTKAADAIAVCGNIAKGPSGLGELINMTFPNYRDVAETPTPSMVVGINATLLKQLADALGAEQVNLFIGDPTAAIGVTPVHAAGEGYGLIMPCTTEAKPADFAETVANVSA